MLKNYLTVALRNLLRHRIYSLLNLAGLSVGLATSILIFLWVRDEVSFDRFHTHANEIYRVTVNASGVKVAVTPVPLADALKTEVPEIADVAQLAYSNRLFGIGDQNFEEDQVFFADESFLTMFDFPLVKGDIKTVLSEPDGLLLTEEMAVKYFGEDEPLGKIIKMDSEHDFTVKGVLKNIPSNSHLQFGIVLPMEFLKRPEDFKNTTGWDYYANVYTYVRVLQEAAADPSVIEKISVHVNEIYARQKMEMKAEFIMQPLMDIHLKSENMMADVAVSADIRYVRIFSLVAIFILVVAAINFMNLATARATRRGREIGMRKVLGAHHQQLVGQFLGESLLLSAIASIIALLLVASLLPAFNDLTGKSLKLLLEGDVVFGLFSIVLLTGLLAGSYPALYQSSFPPIQALKGILKAGPKSLVLRNGLVVFQFVVTIVLVVSTLIVFQQVQFIRHQNLGFDKENLLYVQMNRDMFPRYATLRSKLEASTVLKNFTVTGELPTNNESATYDVKWDGKNPGEQPIFPLMFIDEYYLETMGMTILDGRGFSPEFKADTSNYLVNEKALKVMDMEPMTAVGKALSVNGRQGTIIGVVKDFHFESLTQPIEPLILELNSFGGFIFVKTPESDIQANLGELKRIFEELSPAYPFEYGFLDEDFDALYRTESRIGTLSIVFAVLAIFIACLGLFGLSAFMAEQRLKEIGLRKVVGASVSGLVILLSRNFVGPLLLSIVLATPLSWYLAARWLEGYAYHVTISGWVFVFAALLALFIALLTTGFQTIKAALTSPVKLLRTE